MAWWIVLFLTYYSILVCSKILPIVHFMVVIILFVLPIILIVHLPNSRN